VPYLREFFKVYQPSQKLVVLKMLTNYRVYDSVLFSDFAKLVEEKAD
jgi:hypothetical protein